MSEPWPDELPQRTREVILSGDTYVIDFAPGCGVTRGGQSCGGSAVAWIRWHHVGRCTHPALDHGCSSKLVCFSCLDAYEAKAAHVVKQHRPRWWRPADPKCPTCLGPVQLPTDVLQYTYWLSEAFK